MNRANLVVLTAAHVEAIVKVLCPDVEFSYDPNARLLASRRRLDEISGAQTQALERLDVNRKVVALGAAGTGKTRLAMAWARRAFAREERVLLTCYNDPLAERTAEQMPDDESLRTGSFLKMAMGLEGMPTLDVPAEVDHEWWNHTAVGHLHANWHLVTESFDTIVVDEAQDFSPALLAQLSSILDPDGPRKMLLVADPAPVLGPEATGLTFTAVDEEADLAPLVQAELDRLVTEEERDPDHVVVLTFSSRVRDHLIAVCGLVRWEIRGRGIVCETVHRAKGLESDTVLLVSDTDDVADHLLYIGISRAVSELVVIGPPAMGKRLGLSSTGAHATAAGSPELEPITSP